MNQDDRKAFCDQLSSGEIQFVKDEDEVEFRCQLCGKCCFNQSILLSSYEVYSITRSPHVQEMFGISSTVDFFKKGYGSIFLGSDSKIPLCAIENKKFSEDLEVCPFVAPALKVPEEFFESCLSKKQIPEEFFKSAEIGHFICGLDDAGPVTCRSFPFGRVAQQTLEEKAAGKPMVLKEIMLPVTCAGAGAGHIRVGDYLEAFNVREGWQMTEKHFALISWLHSDAVGLQQIAPDHLLKIGYLMYNFDAFPFMLDKEGQSYKTSEAPFEKIFESIVLTVRELVKMIKDGTFPATKS